MKRILYIAILFLVGFLILRLPILKMSINGNNFYYRDLLGFIYFRNSSCGIIGGCTHWDTPIWGEHILSFKTLKYNGLGCLDAYAKTQNTVYSFGLKQPQVEDPKSFVLLNNLYAKDKHNVYNLCNLNIVSSDGSSFSLVGPACAKDTANVYCLNKFIEGSDPRTFGHVWRGYYKDKYNVYHLGKVLEGVKPDSFELLSWGYMQDESGVYFFDEKNKELTRVDSVDRASFEVLEDNYARDKFNVYRFGVVER